MAQNSLSEKKNKKDRSIPAKIILIIGILLISIPVIALLVILLQAQRDASSPVMGDRYDRNLNPAISKADMEYIESSLMVLEGVEKIAVDINSGTLAVNIDTRDTLSSDQIVELGEKAFEVVTGKLPLETYFTNDSNKRMYDLNITSYNYFNIDTGVIAYNITKNGTGEEVHRDLLNEANDPEYIESLQKDE